jgi:hypothetical protein
MKIQGSQDACALLQFQAWPEISSHRCVLDSNLNRSARQPKFQAAVMPEMPEEWLISKRDLKTAAESNTKIKQFTINGEGVAC